MTEGNNVVIAYRDNNQYRNMVPHIVERLNGADIKPTVVAFKKGTTLEDPSVADKLRSLEGEVVRLAGKTIVVTDGTVQEWGRKVLGEEGILGKSGAFGGGLGENYKIIALDKVDIEDNFSSVLEDSFKTYSGEVRSLRQTIAELHEVGNDSGSDMDVALENLADLAKKRFAHIMKEPLKNQNPTNIYILSSGSLLHHGPIDEIFDFFGRCKTLQRERQCDYAEARILLEENLRHDAAVMVGSWVEAAGYAPSKIKIIDRLVRCWHNSEYEPKFLSDLPPIKNFLEEKLGVSGTELDSDISAVHETVRDYLRQNNEWVIGDRHALGCGAESGLGGVFLELPFDDLFGSILRTGFGRPDDGSVDSYTTFIKSCADQVYTEITSALKTGETK
jgi:hypothetical protein